MECGPSDLKCQLLLLLAKNGGELSHILDLIPGVQTWVRDHIQALFGLAGFAFGVWKWWWYREKVLHKRLAAYLADQNARLHGARRDVLTLIERPGPGRSFSAPLFAVSPLRRLLKDRGWAGLLPWGSIEQRASRRLEGAQAQIIRRMQTTAETLKHHRDQLATAHILHGAVAASRAGRESSISRQAKLDREALSAFRMALRIPGDNHRLEAREYEAHQLLRLGMRDEAKIAYERLAEAAPQATAKSNRRIIAARAKRALAQLELAEDHNGKASTLLEQAVELRAGLTPSHWASIEQGDLHYFLAYTYFLLGFKRKEPVELDKALAQFDQVLRESPRFCWTAGMRKLKKAAKAGKKRCELAANNRNYETSWLHPPSDESQNPSATIGDPGSQKSVGEAAKQDRVDEAKQA